MEILIVIAVLGLLAAIGIPNFVKAKWIAEAPTRNLAHLMAEKGICSDKPIYLGIGWYYLSKAVTNPGGTIATLVQDNKSDVVHSFPAMIDGVYGDSDIGRRIATIVNELAITNGYFIFIDKN